MRPLPVVHRTAIFTSALGIATLDGMGAVGEGAHASHESILLEHLAPRTALLAGMLAKPS